MPRVMDDTFHRLLWVTLVAVAFTFTVILTSVFVDIDDLLAKRTSPIKKQQLVTEAPQTYLPAPFEDIQAFPSSEEDTNENESTFRTKRSLESNNYHLHIKSPKMKKILTNRLATLLEELDEEESSKATNSEGIGVDIKDKNILNSKYVSTKEPLQNKQNVLNVKDMKYDKVKNDIGHKNVLHLAMHNILLQGIVAHMDLNDVYKKVHSLIKSYESNADSDAQEMYQPKFNESKSKELIKIISDDSYKEEDKFFEELTKCEKLQKQILQNQDSVVTDEKEKAKDSHMLIKTTIEITNNHRGNDNLKNPNENTTGAIKLVYNGKEIKSVDMSDDKNVETEEVKNTHIEETQHNTNFFIEKLNTKQRDIQEKELDQAIAEYLKTHFIKFHNRYNIMAKGNFVTKRLKRQIKIHYLGDQIITEKPKQLKEKPKHRDDELYVEIETHFDGKGTKGEKKKKLVRTLIDKIQKAINSNDEVLDQDKTFQQKKLQIKKRMQNRIEHNESILNTISPIDVIEHRQLNPISKTANVIQPLTSVLDKSGGTWKKMYRGPGFLTVSKSLNSAERRELDVDYNSVMKNGIPKRLQKPINTENEDLVKPNEYVDTGNVTLFLKDINGSGFSIGINQYPGEPPDKETLNMFTGLENLIQTYHDHYDQTETISNESEDQNDHIIDTYHELKRRDVNKQTKLYRQWLAADKIMERGKNQEKSFFNFNQSNRRKRRAMNVKLFTNLKSKTKLNKFINTNPMATKKIFLNSKRNKRQINKIRIVASDRYPPTSREDVFLVSRENIYADRAIVKEEETPEVEISDKNEEHYDFIAPYSYGMDIANLQPAYLSNIYDTKSLRTGLMSKYPHIFLENISRSNEFINVSPSITMQEKNYNKVSAESTIQGINNEELIEKNISSTNVDEIVNAILPSRNNFKVVLKIFPKNKTNVGPAYKEVHTLVNKSYDKNGIRYVSSLNVKEISKLESLNKTTDMINLTTANDNEMKEAQNQIKLLLELHKERIDQQLQHLKIESQKLKEMIGHEHLTKNISHLIDIFKYLGLKSPYGRNYFHLNDNKPNIHVTTISNILLTKPKTTVKPIFTFINKEDDSKKMEIISSIKENGNITREILQKIDNNTNILREFLQKLMDQIQTTPHVAASKEKVKEKESTDTPKVFIGDQVINPFFEQLRTNFTNAIPFIYAFHHEFTEHKNKPINNAANVVYHGHIHANKVENDGKRNDFLNGIANNVKNNNNINIINNNKGSNGNETRFFIDELENDFKLGSGVNDRIPVLAPVQSNITKH